MTRGIVGDPNFIVDFVKGDGRILSFRALGTGAWNSKRQA